MGTPTDTHVLKKACGVVKDADLSYLTLTALTLEEMKEKEGDKGRREEGGNKRA